MTDWRERYLNKVTCGDCLELMKDLPDKCVDAVITDPPYGIGSSRDVIRHGYKNIQSAWYDKTPSLECFTEIFRVSKEQVIWGGNYFNLPPSQCFFVWDKSQPENFSSSMCEMAWVSIQSPAKLFQKRVVSIPKYHPTTKPTELMEWCIRRATHHDDIILDPFLGSGTTAISAIRTGRQFIGFEIDQHYCDIANRRIQDELAQVKIPFDPIPEPKQEVMDL